MQAADRRQTPTYGGVQALGFGELGLIGMYEEAEVVSPSAATEGREHGPALELNSNRGLCNRIFTKTTISRFCQHVYSWLCENSVLLIRVLVNLSKQIFSLLHGYPRIRKTGSAKPPYPNKA